MTRILKSFLKSGRKKICCFIVVAVIFVLYVLKNRFENQIGSLHGEPRDKKWDTVVRLEPVILKRGRRKAAAANVDQKTWDLSQECKLPNLKVDDPTLAKFFNHVPPLVCGTEPNWVFLKNGKIYMTPQTVQNHGQFSCRFTQWTWKNDLEFSESPYHTAPSNFNGTTVISDYLQAKCKAADGVKFENYYSTVVPKESAILRAENISKTWTATHGPKVNVYIWAIESMSRVHFIRKLPKTYKFIQSLSPVILEGYNIIGDGTPQALIPMLTGKTEEELPLTRKRFPNAEYVDVYPWIWNAYHNAGYVSLYGEDAYAYGTFQYRLRGFKVQPTDHYVRTYFMKAEPKMHRFNKFCFAGESQHKVFFRTAEDFFSNYPENLKKFALMFYGARLSHEDLNNIEIADSEFAEHFKSMQDSGVLNNTVLFMVADHGHRFAKLRETHQGQLEERLPFFGIAAPAWFREKYSTAWQNLESNHRKLVTPFDIHETLKVMGGYTVIVYFHLNDVNYHALHTG